MAEPPDSGPHSDIGGVNRDARVNAPTLGSDQGGASEKAKAEEESAARPEGGPPVDQG